MKIPLLLIAAFLLLIPSVSAQEQPFSGLPLKRMRHHGVPVHVELNGEFPTGGINSQQIKTDVELRLRKAGVKVQPKGDIPSYPQLVVNLGSLKANDSLFAFSVEVMVFDFVPLDCATKPIAPVITWRVGTVGVAGSSKSGFIRESLADFVDQFINAYLEAVSK